MDSILNEYRVRLISVIEKRIAELIEGLNKQPENAFEIYAMVISGALSKDMARVSTDAIHKSIVGHIENKEGFLEELRKIRDAEAQAANERAIEIVKSKLKKTDK